MHWATHMPACSQETFADVCGFPTTARFVFLTADLAAITYFFHTSFICQCGYDCDWCNVCKSHPDIVRTALHWAVQLPMCILCHRGTAQPLPLSARRHWEAGFTRKCCQGLNSLAHEPLEFFLRISHSFWNPCEILWNIVKTSWQAGFPWFYIHCMVQGPAKLHTRTLSNYIVVVVQQ